MALGPSGVQFRMISENKKANAPIMSEKIVMVMITMNTLALRKMARRD